MMVSRAIFQFSRKNATHLCKVMQRFESRSMSNAPAVKEPHMNDLPIPHEPFETGYKRRQVGNNFVLLAGIVFFSASFGFVLNSGVMVPNLTPPKKNLSE